RHSSSATISSALESTQSIRFCKVASVPVQSLSGQIPHQVMFLLPGVGAQLPALHVFPSWTVPPRFMVQSSRLVATVQLLPVPVRQQKGGLGKGSRLPHSSLMVVSLWVTAVSSLSGTVGSKVPAKQVALVPPLSAHFSRIFSRSSRYLTPALAIPFWQNSSPPEVVPVRLRWSGSGVAQLRSEHTGDDSLRSLWQTSLACEA